MGPLGAPLHLLPLGEALGDDIVHRRFDEASAYSVSLAIALAVVGDEGLVVGDVGVHFRPGAATLPFWAVVHQSLHLESWGTIDRQCLSIRH